MRNRSRSSWLLLIAALALTALGVTFAALTGEDAPKPGPHAKDPACAALAERLPGKLAGLSRQGALSPGVTVWGNNEVIARCGVTPPEKTTDACASINNTDWVIREMPDHGRGGRLLVTYGRRPAVELTISERSKSVDAVLVALSDAVKPIATQSKCLDQQGR
ncbi:DUF3515 domain-containing protein [Streptomyces sp. NPDC019890]|uniref:DUF3515 domain-containing protein n=1 Tax=Streptomyces sp. NPDC019890 TaxID=3365064 RepID=UPI00384ED306